MIEYFLRFYIYIAESKKIDSLSTITRQGLMEAIWKIRNPLATFVCRFMSRHKPCMKLDSRFSFLPAAVAPKQGIFPGPLTNGCFLGRKRLMDNSLDHCWWEIWKLH